MCICIHTYITNIYVYIYIYMYTPRCPQPSTSGMLRGNHLSLYGQFSKFHVCFCSLDWQFEI